MTQVPEFESLGPPSAKVKPTPSLVKSMQNFQQNASRYWMNMTGDVEKSVEKYMFFL